MNVTRVTKRTFTVPDTAAGWDLYDGMPGADDAAMAIAMALDAALALHPNDKTAVTNAVFREMYAQRKYGATDSAVIAVMRRTINLIFGDAK